MDWNLLHRLLLWLTSCNKLCPFIINSIPFHSLLNQVNTAWSQDCQVGDLDQRVKSGSQLKRCHTLLIIRWFHGIKNICNLLTQFIPWGMPYKSTLLTCKDQRELLKWKWSQCHISKALLQTFSCDALIDQRPLRRQTVSQLISMTLVPGFPISVCVS